MKTKQFSTKDLDQLVRESFIRQAKAIPVPPVPNFISVFKNKANFYQQSKALKTSEIVLPTKRVLPIVFVRVAAAVFIIAVCSVLYFRPIRQNQLSLTITSIVSETEIERRIITGLQKVGNYLYDNLY